MVDETPAVAERRPGRHELDARATYDELVGLSDRSRPTRTAYLSSIAGKTCIVYDLQNRPVTVRAENLETYVDKGFTFEPREEKKAVEPLPDLASILPPGDGVQRLEGVGDLDHTKGTEPDGPAVKNDEGSDPSEKAEPEPAKSTRKVK